MLPTEMLDASELLVLPAPRTVDAGDAEEWEELGALPALPPPVTAIVRSQMNAEYQMPVIDLPFEALEVIGHVRMGVCCRWWWQGGNMQG